MSSTPAGWYPDPDNLLQERLWDGSEWVDRVRPRKPVVKQRTSAENHEAALATEIPVIARADDGAMEVVYSIRQSTVNDVSTQNLEKALRQQGIEYYWDDGELVVDKQWESQVDAIVQIHAPKNSGSTGKPVLRKSYFSWAVVVTIALGGALIVNRDSVLGFIRGTLLNNEQAEAACIGRGDRWVRSSQTCWPDPFRRLGNAGMENDGPAEASCRVRGGVWLSVTQACVVDGTLVPGSTAPG